MVDPDFLPARGVWGLGRAALAAMFSLSPTLDIGWVPRRPRNASRLELEGWRFLPLSREWDAVEKEELLAATGLCAFSPSYGEYMPHRWWVSFLRAYLACHDPVVAAREAVVMAT